MCVVHVRTELIVGKVLNTNETTARMIIAFRCVVLKNEKLPSHSVGIGVAFAVAVAAVVREAKVRVPTSWAL